MHTFFTKPCVPSNTICLRQSPAPTTPLATSYFPQKIFDKPKHIRKANEKQADYLFNQLKTAKKAKITKDSYNKDIIEHKIYEISDLSEINSLIESLRFEYVSDYCLCLGSINLEFFLESGETVKINYARGHYIKFNGPGFIQGIPTKEFERRITKILNTKPSKIETGKHLEIFPTLNKEDSFELLRAGGYLEGNKSYISPEKKEYEKKMDK